MNDIDDPVPKKSTRRHQPNRGAAHCAGSWRNDPNPGHGWPGPSSSSASTTVVAIAAIGRF